MVKIYKLIGKEFKYIGSAKDLNDFRRVIGLGVSQFVGGAGNQVWCKIVDGSPKFYMAEFAEMNYVLYMRPINSSKWEPLAQAYDFLDILLDNPQMKSPSVPSEWTEIYSYDDNGTQYKIVKKEVYK